MSLDALLSRLEGVQRSGDGYRARCPACGGKGRKVAVREADTGRILLHCFAGCVAADIVQAIGLQLGDLFPERLAEDTPEDRERRRRLARESQWGAALEVLQFEARIVAIAAGEIAYGRSLTVDDYNRVCTAAERIAEAEAVLTDKPAARARDGLRAAAKQFAERTA